MKREIRKALLRLKNNCSSQDGMALATSLILLAVLSSLALVSIQWSARDVPRTKNFTKSRQAAYLAEAGFHRAFNYFNYDASGDSPGQLANGFNDELAGTTWPAGTFTNIALGAGTYTATLVDNSDNDGSATTDSDNATILTSTGTVGGVSVSVEGTLVRALYKAEHALATDGDLDISGNPTINGTSGSVHSNSDLDLTGSPSVSSTATATGTVTTTGSPTVGGGSASGATTESIPVVTISDYKSQSEYVLGADGIVRDGAGTALHDTSVSDNFRTGVGSCSSQNKGWGYDAGPPVKWDIGDSCGFPGNYYIEGNVELGGNVGSAGSPFSATIIAEGYIETSGGPEIQNRQLAADPEEIQNIFFMAGTDIKMRGNPSTTIQGMIYAGEQIDLGGNVSINGFVLAADAAASESLVTSNDVSGNATITYNGDVTSPFLSNKVTVISWQEL